MTPTVIVNAVSDADQSSCPPIHNAARDIEILRDDYRHSDDERDLTEALIGLSLVQAHESVTKGSIGYWLVSS
jgi:hypothetical protein